MKTPGRQALVLTLACLLAISAFSAYHFYLRGVMLDTGLRLGAVRPGNTVYRIVPLYLHWRPRLKTGVLIAAAASGAFIVWMNRWFHVGWDQRVKRAPAHRNRHHSWWSRIYTLVCPAAQPSETHLSAAPDALFNIRRARLLITLWTWQILIAVAVALIDGGLDTLWEPYRLNRRSDYIGAVQRIDSPRAFLHDYVRLMPDLPLHCRHHPPGGPLLLWAIAVIHAPGPVAASVVTILLAGLAAPGVYLLAREVLDEAPARLAAGFFLLAPNVASYTATCMDAVFMVPLVWSFYSLWRGRRSQPVWYGVAGGCTVSLAALLTFSTSFVALWSVVLLGLTAAFDRTRLRNTVLTLLVALATSAAIYALLFAWSGYDPLAVLRQAFAGQDEVMKGRGHSSVRQSAHFVVANLVAFLFCSGLPVVWLWAGQTWRELRGTTSTGARWLLLSFALTLFIVDLAPLYTLETERIWIFLVSFLAIGAAARLSQRPTLWALVPATLFIEASQTVLMEVLLEWRW